MSIEAARELDKAFAVFKSIADVPDPSPISRQTPSWRAPESPYDFAAELVRALIPLTYNTDPRDKALTELIWTEMVNRMEVLHIDDVNMMQRALCDTCGWDKHTINHYKECKS